MKKQGAGPTYEAAGMRIKAAVEIPEGFRTLKRDQIMKRGDLILGGKWWEEAMIPIDENWGVGEGELVIRRLPAPRKRSRG